MKRALTTISALFLALPVSAGETQSSVSVNSVSVHLLFTPSGELSEDVTALPGFGSWNFRTVNRVEPVDEPFHSFLIKVRLQSTGSVFRKGKVATVTVRSLQRKKLLYSASLNNVYIPEEGEAVMAKLVEGHVCEPIEILVRAGKSQVRKTVEFNCGE